MLICRYSYKQRGQNNTTSSLSLYEVESVDEGVYTCTAENNAGMAEANLSLRILYRERSTTEPPYDPTTTGYVAVIAAGALVGLLIALGCIVGSALLCARRRRQRKRKTNVLASQNKALRRSTRAPQSRKKVALRETSNNNSHKMYNRKWFTQNVTLIGKKSYQGNILSQNNLIII